jgi:hypothetical protein
VLLYGTFRSSPFVLRLGGEAYKVLSDDHRRRLDRGAGLGRNRGARGRNQIDSVTDAVAKRSGEAGAFAGSWAIWITSCSWRCRKGRGVTVRCSVCGRREAASRRTSGRRASRYFLSRLIYRAQSDGDRICNCCIVAILIGLSIAVLASRSRPATITARATNDPPKFAG